MNSQFCYNSNSTLTEQLALLASLTSFNAPPAGNLPLISGQLNLVIYQRLLLELAEERIKNQLLTNVVMESTKQLELHRQIQESTALTSTQNAPVTQEASPMKEEIGEPLSYEREESNSRPFTKKLRKRPRGLYRRFSLMRSAKNETKNIPKNFGKAIAAFIEKKEKLAREVVALFPEMDFAQFLLDIRQRRRDINSIADLRQMWLTEQNEFAPPTRILSFIFLKRYSLEYIFRSRISNFQGHIKYRNRLLEALRNPKTFYSIKYY